MSATSFRKSPLEDDITRESHMSSIPFSKRSKAVEDRPSTESRFLNWVAYHRNLAGPSQITDDERLRCPIMRCRRPCENQNELLEHVFKCTHYSDGRYWCFHCQIEESFFSCQCKHCHAPAFGKDRISVRVRRLLQKLGTKSQQKDHEKLDSSGSSKGVSGSIDSKGSDSPPGYGEVVPAFEMGVDKVVCELKTDCIPSPSELSGFGNIPAELDSENATPSTAKQETPTSRWETSIEPVETTFTSFDCTFATIDTAQVLPSLSPDIHGSPRQVCSGRTTKLAIPADSQRRLQSPISPQNADWTLTSYADVISESPTDTDLSGYSILTSISPPSTRNTTMQSFSHSSLSFDELSEPQYMPPGMQNIIKEIPDRITAEETSSHRQASSVQVDSFHSSDRRDFIFSGSRNVLTPSDFLKDFWEVLRLHVAESAERLRMLMDSPSVNELLSMTASTIAYMGFEVWERIHMGYPPSTVAHLYSLVHVTYACAFVIYDGQVENHLPNLFTQSLSIGTWTLSEKDRLFYTTTVCYVWSPPEEDICLPLLFSAESTSQPAGSPNGQSRTKGETAIYQNGDYKSANQFVYSNERPSNPELLMYEDSEIFNILNHFLDIFQGSILGNKVLSVFEDFTGGFKDENFIRIIKEQVTNPLIEDDFQPGLSLEAFIEAVAKIDMLVSIGHITTIREVEIGLKWAGKSIVQPAELYGIFLSRVKDLCCTVTLQLQLDPTLQIESHIVEFNALWINLKTVISDSFQFESGGAQWNQLGIGLGSPSLTLEPVSSLPGSVAHDFEVDGLPQTDIMHAGVCRRSAIKRKRSSSSSSSSTPENGPYPSSPASPNNLSESSKNKIFRCPFCGFQSKGNQRWHKRSMARHIAAYHNAGHQKTHLCRYEECGSSFTRADNLAQHVRSVHQRNKR